MSVSLIVTPTVRDESLSKAKEVIYCIASSEPHAVLWLGDGHFLRSTRFLVTSASKLTIPNDVVLMSSVPILTCQARYFTSLRYKQHVFLIKKEGLLSTNESAALNEGKRVSQPLDAWKTV
jgi:hypothetical protein